MNQTIRTLTIAFLLALLPLAGPGCSTAPVTVSSVAEAQRQAVIPITAATVEALPDGTEYRLSWQASDAGSVGVYASAARGGSMDGRAMARGAADAHVTVHGIPAATRTYFTLVPARGAPLVVADRGVHIRSVPNLRDAGGYRTTDGRWVRMGMIYRADQLDRLSDADLEALDALDIGAVMDLRTESERSREPDRIPPGARAMVLDVAADSASGSLGGDMFQVMEAAIASGKGAEMLGKAYRDFVSLPSARTAYGTMLHQMLDEGSGAVLYHCTSGKDRTGWATAIILTMLGVPRETVMADYLLSNTYLQPKIEHTLEHMKKSGVSLDPALLEPVMTVNPGFLETAFDEVERSYGSFDAYLRDGLGISAADVERLRARYLAGAAQ